MKARIILTVALAALLAGEALAATAPAAPQVNINTASEQELQLLPRVGPALAKRVVEFRTANGPFKAPEELTRVKGVGEKSYALLAPYLAVSGPTTLTEKVRVPRAPQQSATKPSASKPSN
jgi:competence protein ComEA